MGKVSKCYLQKSIFLFFVCLFTINASACSEQADTYELILSTFPKEAGIVEGSGIFSKGSIATIVAKENEGFRFSHWINADKVIISQERSYELKINRSEKITAVFVETTYDGLISSSEFENIQIIPDYNATNVINDKLLLMTRYIGQDFLTEGISKEKSGVVNDHGVIKMVINTKELQAKGIYRPIIGGGPHIWLSKRFSKGVRPWQQEGQYLSLSAEVTVPYVRLEDSLGNISDSYFSAEQAPVTQFSFGFYLVDKNSGIKFAFIVPMYESRGTYQETANANDTFVSFVSSPIDETSTYITKVKDSSKLQAIPFNDKKFFKILLTRKNLERVINDSQENLSPNISEYELMSVGIIFELPNYVKNGHNTSIAHIFDFNVGIGSGEEKF